MASPEKDVKSLLNIASQLTNRALTWPESGGIGGYMSIAQILSLLDLSDYALESDLLAHINDASVHGGGSSNPLAIIADIKGSTENGGTFTTGAWRTRDLNTIIYDPSSIVSLASNQLTLEAGTYEIAAHCPALAVQSHVARLYDTTAAAEIVTGSSARCWSGSTTQTRAVIQGIFTLSVQSVLEIQHQCKVSNADVGFGHQAFYTDSIYTFARIVKLS